MAIEEAALRAVHDRASLFALLEQLGWSVSAEDTLTYDVPLPGNTNGPRAVVSRIPAFSADDPYALVLVEFESAFRRTDLRAILAAVRAHLRQTQAFPLTSPDQLVFVCATQGYTGIRFAKFEVVAESVRARLRVFGWDRDQPAGMATLRRMNLEKLHMGRTAQGAPDWSGATWSAAWDVEAVTAQFYQDYEQVFTRVESLVRGRFVDRRLFTLRLLNRLFFVRFVEMKGWLCFRDARGVERKDYLRALFQASSGGNFYNDRLYWAFFSGLGTGDQRSVHGLSQLVALRGEVPYLNGGLFEMEADGSDTRGAVQIPNEAFAAILGLFDQYNFTVTESSPDDVEVALDPEMLGKVFEELVTKEDRDAKGAYYTPRTVVSFMCREALKGYLRGHEALIDQGDATAITIPVARELLTRLRAARVVDPACGSGAYVLGMLRELFDLVRTLDVRAELATARDDYDRKLEIIQNNLYGVDILPFAVQIARLRLWLSLVVEYDGPDPPPLPNLDFKIEVGDSLTAPAPDVHVDVLRREPIRQFENLKAAYQNTHDYDGKRNLLAEINAVREDLRIAEHAKGSVDGFDWAVEFCEVFAGGGFDIVLANPPYGASAVAGLRDLYFDRVKEGAQSKDTYGLFMARGLQLMRPGGQFSFIVSDTWRTIRTHLPLRKRLLRDAAIGHVVDLPAWIFGATVNTSILTLTKGQAGEDHKLVAGDLRNITKDDWGGLERNLQAVAAHGPDVQTTEYARYTYTQQTIAGYANRSFFIASPKLYGLMSDARFVRLGDVAEVKQGLATADNAYYLRKRATAHGSYEVIDESKLLTEAEISSLSPAEKLSGVDPARYGGRHFVPYDKGGASDAEEGWLPNYWVPTEYFIDWSEAAIQRLRTGTIADVKRRKGEADTIRPSDEMQRAAVIRNPVYYFKPGITFSPTGVYSPTFRLGCAAVFGNKGSTIFSTDLAAELLLGCLATLAARYLLKAFLSHTVETGEDVLCHLPLPPLSQDSSQQISALVAAIVTFQRTNHAYPYHLNDQPAIDALVYQLYGLDDDDIREIELWYCRRYEKLARAQGVWDEVHQKYAAHLKWCDNIMSKPAGYWRSHPTLQLIAAGESARLEFKETLEADNQTGAKHPGLLVSALKTVAAFLNTGGGTLLIGVSDTGDIKGLNKDLQYCKNHNHDGFEQKLRSLLHDKFNPPPLGKVDIHFDDLPDGTVCRVEVAGSEPVIHIDNAVYVRDGNTTRKLEGRELTEWVAARGPARV